MQFSKYRSPNLYCPSNQKQSQLCIVYDRKATAADIKKIYKAPNEQMLIDAFNEFKAKWSGKYHLVVKSWETKLDKSHLLSGISIGDQKPYLHY
ncbi:MAG: hypothetical protein IPN46_19485 [Saprospiraceae bacterium]|nr:hypothetical protein [Saprospiraceae bacterium]